MSARQIVATRIKESRSLLKLTQKGMANLLHAQVAERGNQWAEDTLKAAILAEHHVQTQPLAGRWQARYSDAAAEIVAEGPTQGEALAGLAAEMRRQGFSTEAFEGFVEVFFYPRNAKSAAPTEGAALEMPGLTGGQRVGLEDLAQSG